MDFLAKIDEIMYYQHRSRLGGFRQKNLQNSDSMSQLQRIKIEIQLIYTLHVISYNLLLVRYRGIWMKISSNLE